MLSCFTFYYNTVPAEITSILKIYYHTEHQGSSKLVALIYKNYYGYHFDINLQNYNVYIKFRFI
jgi:hypothetical protein